ncbi:MAG TPA: TIGR03619 family F420-dependent LLM class oxidoreductase [Acidimicrobiia bacterium]|nr:TIGR03619 family F420-dependent LLM class oxidoreductase [Acidimicrobiia bacterium]
MNVGWFGIGSGLAADAEGVAEVAAAAEDLGYESVWVGEHPVLIDPQAPPSPLAPTSEMLDPVPTLAYVAARTGRIRLGTGIIILPLRQPLILAKQLASVDVLSGGRLIVGIGVGYVPGEYEAIDVPFRTRGERADEYIEAMRSVWCDEHPHYDGATVGFSGIQCYPRPLQPGGPPIHGSGMSRAARRRSVTMAQGWYGFYLDLERTAEAIAELAELEREHGRPAELGPLEITITPPAGPIDAATAAAYEDLGVHRLVLSRDFADLAGAPDPERRGELLREMERTAAELHLS